MVRIVLETWKKPERLPNRKAQFPSRAWTCGIRIHLGRCRHCGRRVQGRDRRQTERWAVPVRNWNAGLALGHSAEQRFGLPYGKTVAVLQQGWGLLF